MGHEDADDAHNYCCRMIHGPCPVVARFMGSAIPLGPNQLQAFLCAFFKRRGAVDLFLTISCSCFVVKNALLCADRGCVSSSSRLRKKPLQ